jgi:L-threonylcarbamoyladenylate synthase
VKTEILKIEPTHIDIDKINYAADVLKGGGLVVLPTETVYGLGANGLDKKAVEKIFIAKGRPSDNPLILHVAEKEQLEVLVKRVDEVSSKLIEAFWPGPLTLVMNKSEEVPQEVTSGIPTVAIRMPSHPVALSLIYAAGFPVAAPSANISGRPSPTRVEHVITDLDGKVDLIIDSGPCKVGLESTVLDISTGKPMVLRPGGIGLEDLKKVLGEVLLDAGSMENGKGVIPKSPGMKYTHYSPKAQLRIVSGDSQNVITKIKELSCQEEGGKIGILATDETLDQYKGIKSRDGFPITLISVGKRKDKATIAAQFFHTLRKFDEEKVEVVLAEAIDESGIGLAIMNRMNKAAGYNIISV